MCYNRWLVLSASRTFLSCSAQSLLLWMTFPSSYLSRILLFANPPADLILNYQDSPDTADPDQVKYRWELGDVLRLTFQTVHFLEFPSPPTSGDTRRTCATGDYHCHPVAKKKDGSRSPTEHISARLLNLNNKKGTVERVVSFNGIPEAWVAIMARRTTMSETGTS